MFTALVLASCALISACAFLAVALVVRRNALVTVAAVVLPLGVFALAFGLEHVDWRVVVILTVVYANLVLGGLAGVFFAGVILERSELARRRRHG